jgi:PST family polysaccharide transporter
MNLLDTILRGVSWAFASRVSAQVLRLSVSVALARLLSPSEFGTIGMLVVFVGFAQVIADGGLNYALIHTQHITERHYSTVFWLQLALATCLYTLFFLGDPLIAKFYADPILEPLTRLVSCVFIIQAFGYAHSAVFLREFQNRTLAIINVISTLVGGISAIGLAALGYGVWALAWQSLISSGTSTLFLLIHSRWSPRFTFDRQAGLQLGRYGLYLLGNGSLNYWLRSADNLLIGKYLGAHQLGIYALAYNLMILPINSIASVLGDVLFPALSRIQDDVPRFRRTYIAATRMIALVSFPLMAGMAAVSEPLILLLFGEKWAEVIPIVRILCFIGLLGSIVHPVGWIFNALGRTREQLVLSIVIAPAFLLAIVIGLQYGIIGVAYAYAVWAFFAELLCLHIATKYIGLTAAKIINNVAQIGVIAAIMGIIVFSFDVSLSSKLPLIVRLAMDIVGGISTYVALCLLTKNKTFAEVTRLGLNFIGR